MFRLSLFAGASLSGPSGPPGGRVSQRRPLAMLSLLALSEGGLLSRDKLVAYLWPETESGRARHLLSVTLHAIRKALGKEAVLSVGDDLKLNPEIVAVDVREFEAALADDRPDRAVELYAGPLMDGFHVGDAPEFERWLDAERTRLSRRYAGALEILAERSEAEGDVRRALERWRKLAAHDPYSSRVALRLMQALERAGDRPGALRVARVHGALVREELRLEPDPDVVELADRLENGEVEREERPEPTRRPPARDSSGGGGGAATKKSSFRLPPRVAAAVGLLLLAGGLTVLASPEEEPAYDTKSVLVDLFANRTGDRSLNDVGRMATDWITQGLAYTGFVDVVTLGTPLLARTAELDVSEAAERGERLERIAREHGTGTLVSGNVYGAGDSLYFQAHVTDAVDGRVIASLEPVAASAGAPVSGLEVLRDRVMTALATRTDPRLERWQRNASTPPSYEAYERFVEGLDLMTNVYGHRNRSPVERLREAANRFRDAAALDPGFTMAGLWEAMSLGNARSWDEAESILHRLDARRERLAPLDRAFLDYQLGRMREFTGDGDGMSKLRAARRMVEIAPSSEYLKLAGSAALDVDRPAEAVRHYERANPEGGWLRGWTPYWWRLASAHHRLGNYLPALDVARRGRTLYPQDARIREQEIRALGALGRSEELEAAVDAFAALDSDNAGWGSTVGAEELLAHGHEEASERFFRTAIQGYRAAVRERSDRERFHRLALVRLLRQNGDMAGANEQLEILMAEDPEDPRVLRAAGLLRAAEGKREAAIEFLRRFEELDEMWWIGFGPEIAALLGDREWAMDILRRYEESAGLHGPYYRHAPDFRALWGYPPFQDLMRP